MKTSAELEIALNKIKFELETSVKLNVIRVMTLHETKEVLFNEHEISSPIHQNNSEGNLIHTIYGIKVCKTTSSNDSNFQFLIDTSYDDDYETSINEISIENLLYICENLELITE